MTRAEQKLYLTWAQFRRRWGGGQPEPCIPSRFLKEVPRTFCEDLSIRRSNASQVDLYAERHYVRESARRNLYTGKAYNSVENISQFFADKGMPVPRGIQQAQSRQQGTSPAPPARPPQQQPQAPVAKPPQPGGATKKKLGPGSIVTHPKFGRGTVMRREGDGDDARLTINFPGYGLKKLIEKYAGIKE